METPLTRWSEVIGTYYGLHSDDCYVYVKVAGKIIAFANASEEASAVKRILQTFLIGEKIGMLRTDDNLRPILIRRIK